MKYESELIKEIVDTRGHEKSSLHYQSECVKNWINEAKEGYPKLTEYQAEWLNYIVEHPIGNFPYETLSDVTEATVDNVVPYAYRSAILKGNTKYRDIDTGDILDTFDETKNLELVSVKMPVLTTTGKNLFPNIKFIHHKVLEELSGNIVNVTTNDWACEDYLNVPQQKTLYTNMLYIGLSWTKICFYDENKNRIAHIVNNDTIIFPENAKYWRISAFVTPENSQLLNQIMLCNSLKEARSAYEPFKSIILTVNEDIKLCGIGDIRDELDCLTGKVTKRISERVLNGSENWILHADKTYTKVFKLTVDNIKDISHQIICDCLPTNADGDVEKITNTVSVIYLALSTSKANTLAEFKAYLSNNPMIVQYPLKTESDKTVDLTVKDQDGNTLSRIKPIEGTMHLSTTGTPIKPTFNGEIPVEATNQNLASFIKE